MNLLVKGIVMGFIVVLPGMSGGTLLLILGLYEKLLKDLSRLKLWPWAPFILGSALGVYLSGATLTWLFQSYRDIVSVFLLGSVLASVRPILGSQWNLTWGRGFLLIAGIAAGVLMAGEPIGLVDDSVKPGVLLLFTGGGIASAAMLVPGIPGSSVLIVMGIYDNILNAVGTLDLVSLAVFGSGAVVGILGLANAMDKLYAKYRAPIGWFFSGLIIGSAGMLLPSREASPVPVVIAFVIGFALVWWWGVVKDEPTPETS